MLPFMLFAFVASITPGPTNILVLSNGARFGWWATVPSILGACGGAALLVWVVGTGVGQSLLEIPGAQPMMAWAGVIWLSWLAWKVFTSPARAIEQRQGIRLGFLGAAALQVVNPKTWMMALAVVSVFTQGHEIGTLALVFFLVALPCMACWALMGVGAAHWLSSPGRVQGLNRALAMMLLVTAWMGVLL